jgi:hypothetical protein
MRFKLFKRDEEKTRKYRKPLRILSLIAASFIVVIAPFIIVQLLNPSQTDAAWYSTSWNFRKQITIQDSKVSGSSNFSNFPVLISIQDSNLGASAQSDGDDILFTSDNGTTQLSHEIERYDSTTGTLYAWVEVSTLYAQQDTNIFMYYGNATVSSQQNATGTWDEGGNNNFKAVWHLSENPTTTCTGTKEVCDSTQNNNDGDANGSMTATDRVDGKVGYALDFDGSNDSISVVDSASLHIANGGALTISGWIKTTTSGASVLYKMESGSFIDRYEMTLNTGCLQVGLIGSNGVGSSNVAEFVNCDIDDGDWHLVAVTYNYTSDNIRYYIDGALVDTQSLSITAGMGGSADSLFIGDQAGSILDEVRLSNTDRSTDWLTTEYNNQSSPTTFTTNSPQQTQRDRVLHWGFNEGSGTTANDSSGNNNAGTISGATWQAEEGCLVDKCLKFDGSNDIVSKTYSGDTDLDAGTASFSVGGWFRHSSTISGTDTLISRADGLNGVGYKVYMNSSGNMCFGIDGSAGSFPSDSTCSTASYADSRWHYVQGVKSGTTSITVYIDGKQVGTPDTSITSSSISGTSSAFRVGIDADGTSNPWDGFIDEISYYDVVRSASQIISDFNAKGGSDGASSTFGAGSAAESLSNGLVGYWKLDENTGTSTADSSGNGFTGTLTNSPTWTSAGKFGSAVSFDGAQVSNSDVIDMGDQTALELSTFTISAWVYRSGACAFSTCPIFDKGMSGNIGYSLELADSIGYKARLSIRDGLQAVTGTTTIATNTWYHIAATVSGSTIKLYVNGILEGQAVQTVQTNFGNETVKIGNRNSGNDITHNGRIDDVRVYNREISSTEVLALYDWAPGPMGYWKLDERTGTSSVADSSGNGFSGTLNSIQADDWVSGKYGSGIDLDTSDSISVADNNVWSANNTNQLSVMGWIKLDTLSSTIEPFNKGNGSNYEWALRIFSDGSYRALLFTSAGGDYLTTTQTGTGTFTTGRWYHYAMTVDLNTPLLTLYINGVPVATSSTTAGSYTNGTATVRFGERQDGSNDTDGTIDDIRIYNYARTSKQIISDMNAGHPTVGTPVGGPAGHWSFDEGYGTTANDKSPNGNSLTSGGIFSTTMFTNSGKFGKAWDGNGANWMFRADDNDFDFAASDNFTISTWFKSDSASNPATIEYIINKANATNQGYALYALTTGSVCLGIDDDTTWSPDDETCTGTDVYDSTWHHIAAIKTGTTRLDTYLDGKLISSGADTSISATGTLENTQNIYFGDRGGSNDGNEFNGNIDEAKIYRSALNADEVKAEYNQGKSQVLGALSTASDGTTADNSSSRAYCIPGDTTTCDAPIGHWKLDENTGSSTVNDSSTNGFALTFSGFTGTRRFWSQGKVGSAIDFDGSDDVLSYDDSVGTDGGLLDVADGEDFTIETWVYKTNNSADHGLIGKKSSAAGSGDAGYSLMHYSTANGGNVCFYASDGTDQWEMCTANDILTAGRWYHIAAVFDDASATLSNIYINGVASKSSTAGTLANVGTLINGVDFEVGAVNTALTPLNGKLDDVKMFLYTRSAAQVAWDYNRGGPTGWWKFDECSGTTVYDSSGNGRNGTIIPGAGNNTAAGTCTSGTASEMWNDGVLGKFNASLGFDDDDDYVEIASPSLPTVDFTYSAWINIVSDSSSDVVLMASDDATGNDDEVKIKINTPPETVEVTLNDSAVITSTGAVPTSTWTHIAFTRSGSAVQLYINGKPDGSGTDGTALSFSTCSLLIGLDSDSGCAASFGNFLEGKIDDVQVYNYALTQAQIKMLYDQNAAVRFGPATGQP